MKLPSLASVLLACVSVLPAQAESPSGELLIGKWKHVKLVQFADGKLVRSVDGEEGATTQFTRDGTWQLRSQRTSNSGTYRLIGDGKIATVILESNIPRQIGYASVKTFTVDAKTLELVTTFDEKAIKADFGVGANGSGPKEMIVRSTFERIDSGSR